MVAEEIRAVLPLNTWGRATGHEPCSYKQGSCLVPSPYGLGTRQSFLALMCSAHTQDTLHLLKYLIAHPYGQMGNVDTLGNLYFLLILLAYVQ